MALKLFLMRAPREILDLPHFRKMAKEHGVALIGVHFIQKIPCVRKF